MLNRSLKFFVLSLLVFSLSVFSNEGIWKQVYLPVNNNINKVEISNFKGSAKATIEILSEDFEGEYPGWTYVDGNSDGFYWQVGSTGDLGTYTPPSYGTRYAFNSDDDAGDGVINTNEEWLSPSVFIPSYADSLKLEYGWGFRTYQLGEEMRVHARFFKSGVWSAWNPLITYTGSGSGTEVIDLTSELPADSVQVRWLYNDEASTSHWGWACAVDNVKLTIHTWTWILSNTPVNGSTDVPNGAVISAKFDRAMKPSTINTDNVYLRTFTPGPGGGEWSRKISGTVSYNPQDSTMTFVPTGVFLADSQKYYLTISENVQDTNGVPMGINYTWSWTTTVNQHIERAFISNGRFKDGLKGWRIYSLQGSLASQPNTGEVVDLGSGNYGAHIVRDQTYSDGGVLGIRQDIYGYVGPLPYLYLSADLNLASGIPYPLRNVKVIVNTTKGEWVGTYTSPIGSWFHIVSPNLIEYLGLTSDDMINYVWIGNNSYAWGFDIYVDNVNFSYVKDGHLSKVLLLSNEGDFDYLRNSLMEFGDIDTVEYFNGHLAVPTLSYLSNYDAVIVIDGNYGWFNDTATGDTLFEFLNNGGGIVMGGVCWDPQPGGTYILGGGLNGSIMQPGSNPYIKGPGSVTDYYSLGWYDEYHPVMWDVDEFGGFAFDSVTLSPYADTIAKFSGHTFGIASKQQFVAIPGYWGWQNFPDYPYGDYIELIHNSVTWSVHPFINGGFQTGDRLGWTFHNIYNPTYPEPQYEIVNTGGEPPKALRMFRNSTFNGGLGEMFQRFNEDVSGWTYVTLSFYVRIDWQQFTGDLTIYKEYPAKVLILYEDGSGIRHWYYRYFYLSAINVDPEAEQLTQNTWYLRQYDLKTAKFDIAKVLGVYLQSQGWGYDAYFGDVRIVDSPVGIVEEQKGFKVELIKNLGNDNEIRLFIPSKSMVQVSLINITGQKVKEIFSGELDRGQKSFEIKGETLTQGIYFVQVECGKDRISKKIVIVK